MLIIIGLDRARLQPLDARCSLDKGHYPTSLSNESTDECNTPSLQQIVLHFKYIAAT